MKVFEINFFSVYTSVSVCPSSSVHLFFYPASLFRSMKLHIAVYLTSLSPLILVRMFMRTLFCVSVFLHLISWVSVRSV
jgi:hypothetical protein